MLKFEWDTAKADKNWQKHKVSFEEAASVFGDPLALTFADPDHSIGEKRWLTFGVSCDDRLLAVIHVEIGRIIRVVSARNATRHERAIYEQG